MKKLMLVLVVILINSFFLTSCGENKNPMIQEQSEQIECNVDSVYVALNTIDCSIVGVYLFYNSAVYGLEEQGLEPPQGVIIKTKLTKD